ncbi:MAG: tetratricopeptide repeat protein [Candidatus Poribacteria bacterium]
MQCFKKAQKKSKKKQYEEGIQILSEVIRLAPEFAEGYNQRAVVYFMLEEWQKSIDDCQKTVELNPYHFGALAGMGHCYIRLGDLKAAMQAYQRALEINPNLYEIADTLLRIQEALRQHFEE